MKAVCENCEFFVKNANPKGTELGQCRRYPPPGYQGFPGVRPDDWCGEWSDGEGGYWPDDNDDIFDTLTKGS